MVTIARSRATTMAMGTSIWSPRARLDAPAAITNRISSVAYAVEEMASEEKVARAMRFERRWCSDSDEARGRPIRTRLVSSSTTTTVHGAHVKRSLRSPAGTSRSRQDRHDPRAGRSVVEDSGVPGTPPLVRRLLTAGLSPRRQLAGLVCAGVSLPLLTALLVTLREDIAVESALLL